MAVMRHLTVDGTTYDTVGEASVTQVQTSGTKIATVSIDGTSTDLYAPSGGSSVEPSSTTPAMDGTAAVGTATTYARADHVHPTDTSRQAALVSGTNIKTINNESILGSGNIAISTDNTSTDISLDGTPMSSEAAAYFENWGVGEDGADNVSLALNALYDGLSDKQDTLVSGTNIKTVNGTSLLGSGNISIPALPSVSASDDGKVLRVVNGAWAAASLPSASGVSF